MMSMEPSPAAFSPSNVGDAIRLSSFGSPRRGLSRCPSTGARLRLLKQGSTHKRFDSGDWCMERAGLRCKDEIPLDVSMDQLSPKLCPEPSDKAAARPPSVLQYTRTDMDHGSAVVDGHTA